MDRFNILELIGEGSFGRVFKGVSKTDPYNTLVALKLIPKVGHSDRELNALRSECKIQKELSHVNVVRMLDAFETVNELVAVTEFVPGGDLHKLFRIYKTNHGVNLPEDRVRRIACNLISACGYLHSHRVLHRDIKPQNVLISRTGDAKLCDFGFARDLGIHTFVLTSIKGTPLYMAPELIEEKPYDHSADLWSVGCILYELLVGTPPFSTSSLFQLIKKVRYESVNWKDSETWSPECFSFLRGLLEKDWKRRLTWPNLLHHDFVKDGLCLDGCRPGGLTESQELAKEIQRQDCVQKCKSKTGGGALLKLAQKYEERRRFSDVSIQRPQLLRRPSDLSARFNVVVPIQQQQQQQQQQQLQQQQQQLQQQQQYLNPVPPIVQRSNTIQVPDSSDEIGWIEYLNDKLTEEEVENKKKMVNRNEISDCFSCFRSVIVLERFVTLLMSRFIPDMFEDIGLMTVLYEHVTFLKSQQEEEEEYEEEEVNRVMNLFTCFIARCLISSENLVKEFINSSFFDDDVLMSIQQRERVLDIYNATLYTISNRYLSYKKSYDRIIEFYVSETGYDSKLRLGIHLLSRLTTNLEQRQKLKRAMDDLTCD